MRVMGLGVAALGRPGYLNLGHADDLGDALDVEAMRRRCHAMLDAAWESGVRHFDAARSYGLGEDFIGDWLRDHPGRREQLTLGSKWGYTYVADWRTDADVHEVKDHSPATFERQWPETLEALGGPPDLYLIHSLTPDSPALTDDRLLGALRELAHGGVRVGFSTSGPAQADVITRALELPGSPFSAVQTTWNSLEPSAGPVLAEAHSEGWHVTIKEGVANGRLTSRGTVDGPVRRVADRHGVAPDTVALAHALQQPVDVVLSGAAASDHLRSNLAARELTLSADDATELAECAEAPETYWRTRSALPWQ